MSDNIRHHNEPKLSTKFVWIPEAPNVANYYALEKPARGGKLGTVIEKGTYCIHSAVQFLTKEECQRWIDQNSPPAWIPTEHGFYVVEKPALKDWSPEPPTEQGWYWHWNGDPECNCLPTSVLFSGTSRKCFVSGGQLGLTKAVDCDEYGGYWLPMIAPNLPTGEKLTALTLHHENSMKGRQ